MINAFPVQSTALHAALIHSVCNVIQHLSNSMVYVSPNALSYIMQLILQIASVIAALSIVRHV